MLMKHDGFFDKGVLMEALTETAKGDDVITEYEQKILTYVDGVNPRQTRPSKVINGMKDAAVTASDGKEIQQSGWALIGTAMEVLGQGHFNEGKLMYGLGEKYKEMTEDQATFYKTLLNYSPYAYYADEVWHVMDEYVEKGDFDVNVSEMLIDTQILLGVRYDRYHLHEKLTEIAKLDGVVSDEEQRILNLVWNVDTTKVDQDGLYSKAYQIFVDTGEQDNVATLLSHITIELGMGFYKGGLIKMLELQADIDETVSDGEKAILAYVDREVDSTKMTRKQVYLGAYEIAMKDDTVDRDEGGMLNQIAAFLGLSVNTDYTLVEEA